MSNQRLLPKAIFLILMGSYCTGCATLGTNIMQQDKRKITEELKVIEAKGPAKAVVVLVHGLNLKPEKMDDWAQALADQGATTVRVALLGHRGFSDSMAKVTAQNWHDSFGRAMELARNLAEPNQTPIDFLGFSLGALVGLEWLSQFGPGFEPGVRKMVLIAPAISTPWYGPSALSIFSVFGQSFSLPSRTPAQYRANKGSPLAAYRALFELKKSLESNEYKNANIPALILIDKHDELVSSKTIAEIIDKQKLGQWSLDLIDNGYAFKNFGFRHLMVDQESVGPKLWEELKTKVFAHFEL
jgi:alpha-beta hydrolase superfamily lysophospholipase